MQLLRPFFMQLQIGFMQRAIGAADKRFTAAV